MKTVPLVKIGDNETIPQIGFGTWMIKDKEDCLNSVKTALDAGYRHFDTAQIYGNEAYIGEALESSQVDRKDLFITTKIWNENQFWDDLIPSFEQSLKNLRTDYVDLLLLHFPVTELRRPAWRRMEDLYKLGKAKSIGVSNYTIKHLEELLSECSIKPAVNQVELHVFLQQPELVDYCKKNGIVVEAYSPLAHGYKLSDTTIKEIAKKHNKSYSQIMIRWCLDQGFVVFPKSAHETRIKENIDVFDFELDETDKTKLKKLDEGLRTCWDPTHVA